MAKPNLYPTGIVTDATEYYHQNNGVNTKTTALQFKEYLDAQAGGSGDTSYVHTQPSPSLSWSITHNLGKRPNVTVTEGANTVEGDITYSSDNSLIITFTTPTSGTAYLS